MGDETEEMDTQQQEIEAEELGETEETDVGQYQLNVLVLIRDLQQKHGLRHGDYQRYRGYCSRRIARVRKVLHFVQGEKKKFNKKDVTLEILKDEKYLHIPLLNAERAWAYAMQLKFEMNTETRKKFHMINRLRKAKVHSEQLEKLVMATERCNARTKLEVQAYNAWIAGTLYFELQDWKQSMASFTAARTIYEKLAAILGEEEGSLYRQKMEEIVPNLRYCAYNVGDASARQDLLGMRGHEVEDLIKETREEQAATLQEVEWRKRKMPVKQEKVRMFLLREQEFKNELDEANNEEKIEAYESLLLDCKDAIQVLRDDLIEDPNFRNRQQVNEGPVSSMHFLYTYLMFLRYTKTIERNLVMITAMKDVLEGKATLEDGKKPVRPQDLVRLYETVIQNLAEIPQLAGLEEDIEFRQKYEAQIGFYKAARCNYIAQAFLAAQKWPEAMALYQRATVYANKAKKDGALDGAFKSKIDDLLASIESKQFMAHANSILDNEGITEGVAKICIDKTSPLIDRLDDYYEDPDLVKGKANLAHFPPQFQPIPCKPLFFDLAREHLAFPSLEDKLVQPGQGGQKQGGWLGGWLGGWGGKK